jgi:hypothetical protein
MSIKGYKSQQALMNKLKGYTEEQSCDNARYVTIQELQGRKHALDTYTYGQFAVDGLDKTVEVGSNIRVLISTAHGALKNDFIRFADGTQCAVISIPDANTIITSVELDFDPTGLTFKIYRSVVPLYNPDGSTIITIPVGISTSANQVLELAQLTTANTKLDTLHTDNGAIITTPTALVGGSGILGYLSAIWTALNGVLKVSPSVQVASHVQSLTIDGTTAQLFTAPANAKWVKIQADDNNSVNLKVAFGVTATATIGHKFAAGRSEDFQAVADISIIAESVITGQGIYITWGV